MNAPRRALVVVDVQQEYFDGALRIQHPPRDGSLARILEAVDVAEANSVPLVIVQHESPAGAPIFAAGSRQQELHADLAARVRDSGKRITKRYASVFDGTDFRDWCRAEDVDTITLVGYMTNNCILATAAAAAANGVAAEVLSDATGAIDIAHDGGAVSARQVHETLMVLLHSNFAAVATTAQWAGAVSAAAPLSKSNLVASAARGAGRSSAG